MREWLQRKRGNLTQNELAQRAGISQNAYSAIETGNRNPSVKMAKKIAKALDFDWTEFFKDDAQDKPQTDKKPA